MDLKIIINILNKFLLTFFLNCLVAIIICAQTQEYVINIKRAVSAIEVDGNLDESDWQEADIAKDFYQQYPYDTGYALSKTEVRLTYDDDYFYLGVVCYDELPGDYIIQSLKRDYSFSVGDAFAIFIDPFNDKTNGFAFYVNPPGARSEGLIAGGGTRGVTRTWDNKWYSHVTKYGNKWVAEMAIPFKTLRFEDGISEWGVNFGRNDLKRNERSTWMPVPRNFDEASLAYTGKILWDKPPAKTGANISLIPYITGRMNEDFENNSGFEITGDNGFKPAIQEILGIDVKIAVTSSLNLDLTINPDFSQVEVDEQQINLTRFSLFFPEKRQFFIENSDLFGQFGFSQIRPFFSRNIGLYQGQTIPIIAGARLSGKINKNWRIGLMNIQTTRDTTLDLYSQNYTVAAVQRQVFGPSYIGAIFVNRQAYGTNTDNKFSFLSNNFNRVLGLDYNLASKDNKLRGKVFYHHSFTPDKLSQNSANASWLMYNSRNIFAMWNHEYVGKNYIADVGFVPHLTRPIEETGKDTMMTYWRLEPLFQYKFYPKSSIINYHGPAFKSNDYFEKNLSVTDYFLMPHYIINFLNTSELQVHHHEFFTKLFFDRDVTNTGQPRIPAGNYYYRNVLIKYNSDKRKRFNYFFIANYGGYYNGTKLTYNVVLKFRKTPWGKFSLEYKHDRIRLPTPPDTNVNIKADIILIVPKIELTFTKNIFFTTFIQYNTQSENININSRLQWRFKPVSDLFIVYTENYDPILSVKNRALVVKLTYWLNL